MCASALRQIGIRHVYFGCGNDKFGGNGSVFCIHNEYVILMEICHMDLLILFLFSARLETPTSKPYPSQGGFFREEAIILLRKFYVRENDHGKIMKDVL